MGYTRHGSLGFEIARSVSMRLTTNNSCAGTWSHIYLRQPQYRIPNLWTHHSKARALRLPFSNPYEFLSNLLAMLQTGNPRNLVSEGRLIHSSDGGELYVVNFIETSNVYSKTYNSELFLWQKPTTFTSSYNNRIYTIHIRNAADTRHNFLLYDFGNRLIRPVGHINFSKRTPSKRIRFRCGFSRRSRNGMRSFIPSRFNTS